jgi:hypothetical protein
MKPGPEEVRKDERLRSRPKLTGGCYPWQGRLSMEKRIDKSVGQECPAHTGNVNSGGRRVSAPSVAGGNLGSTLTNSESGFYPGCIRDITAPEQQKWVIGLPVAYSGGDGSACPDNDLVRTE